MMSSLPSSRRQLLGGLLACLCGLFSGRKAKAAGPAQPPSTSTFCDGRPFRATAFYDKLGTVTTFTYDGGGRLLRLQD